MFAGVVALAPLTASSQDYDGCQELFYDAPEDACGGGHQHAKGKREESALEQSRHRHRYIEAQIAKLQKQVEALQGEIAQLKRPAAK